jgi:hypothetical protein
LNLLLLNNSVDETDKTTEEIVDDWTKISDTISDKYSSAIVEAINSGKNLRDSMSDVATEVIRMFEQMIIKAVLSVPAPVSSLHGCNRSRLLAIPIDFLKECPRPRAFRTPASNPV